MSFSFKRAEAILNESTSHEEKTDDELLSPHKEISLSKLENFADFFDMPLDYLRKDSKFKTNNVTGNNNFVGNVSISTNLMLENQSLRKELEGKNAIIKAKDETIETLRHMNKMLKAQTDNSIKKEK